MKISSNFIRFHNEFGLKKTIDIFADAGYEGIDFNTDLAEYFDDTHNKDFYLETKKYANDRGICFYQTHAPFASSFADEEKTRIRFDEIVKSLKHSSWLGADMVVVHPFGHIRYKEHNCYNQMMEYNIDFYNRLIPYAEEYNVKIAIENIHNFVTEYPEGLLELFNTLNNKVFTICFDVGHSNIVTKDPAGDILKLGNNIGCTHIHDNDGTGDMHTLPYYGNINWEDIMKALADVGYDGNLNYEAGLFVNTVPLSMREHAAKYMAKMAMHLVDRFNFYKNNK